MVLEMVRPEVRTLVHTSDYGKFEVEPLERGYGTTLGNALRRVLLSSLPGAAVTAVRIEGVLHEFAAMPGIKEDVVQFLLNLKNLALRVQGDKTSSEPRILRLEAKGIGRVMAADIRCPADVEIANPELYLATISDPNASLNVDIYVETGRGYVPAEQMDRYRGHIGMIQVSALFSPIRKVNYLVEATRVKERTDYDRLILEVWTNGSIQPAEAIARAAQLLQDQIRLFTDFDRYVGEPHPGVRPSKRVETLIPDIRVEELNFSQRTYNRLKSAGIHTLRELSQQTRSQLMRIKNFGKKSLEEVEQKLAKYGITLPGTSKGKEEEEEI